MKNYFPMLAQTFFILCILAVSATPILADTNIAGGPIVMNTTWKASSSPYVLDGSIVVGFDATLTIDPGVVIKVKPGFGLTIGSGAFGNGTLVAIGTEEDPIKFTSIKDPNHIADPALPGDWVQITFSDYAEDAESDGVGGYTGCVMKHVIVEYAGQFDQAAVFAERSSPIISNCTIRHNAKVGIAVDSTSTPAINITDCEISHHSARGISISKGAGHIIANCDIHNNGGGIYIVNAPSNILTANNIHNNSINANGGGIYFNSAGSNTLTGNTIADNTSTNNSGGGICFSNSGSNTLTDNTFTGNSTWTHGGGIYSNLGGNTLRGNTINSNVAVHYYGGGAYLAGGTTVLTDNSISLNTALGGSGYGGGLYLAGHNNTVTGNVINENHSSKNGGGLYLSNNNHILSGNTISGNITDSNGGGFYNSGGTSLAFTSNTITDNTAFANGGGFFAERGHNCTFTLNVIRANRATYEGGGIYLTDCDNNVFVSSAIAYNETSLGETGGIFVTNDSANLSLAGDPELGLFNTIVGNDEFWIYNNNDKLAMGTAADINAGFVQWGTNDGMVLNARLYDFFDNQTKGFIMFPPIIFPADFDRDGDVDLVDFFDFIENWLRIDCQQPGWCNGADMDVDGNVDMVDFADFSGVYKGN